jgi:hypothetical protein
MNPISDSALAADETPQRLKADNERFIAGTARFPTVQKKILADLPKGQHPYATTLSCSDSRSAARVDLRCSSTLPSRAIAFKPVRNK